MIELISLTKISHDIILFRWIEMNFISQLFVHDCQKIFSYILKSAIATIVTDNWLDKLCELFHLLLIHWKQWKWKQVIQSFAAVLIHLSNIS